ncbi:MAG: LUD domain-containing protein [Bacteroidetes bacterium]|nr:LUD domain-containing protein [Bacteroidota bacterium]
MEESTSKEKMLKSIRNALIHKSEPPVVVGNPEKKIYVPITETLDIAFAEEFTKVNGNFVYCEDIPTLIDNLKAIFLENNWSAVFTADPQLEKVLKAAEIPCSTSPNDFLKTKVGVTFCESLVARVGAIVISSKQTAGRKLNIYPETHVVVAMASQIVPDIQVALKVLREKYANQYPSLVSIITGPSVSFGIENLKVTGATGTRNLFVFLVDDSPENQ